jgi:hypothetical protein
MFKKYGNDLYQDFTLTASYKKSTNPIKTQQINYQFPERYTMLKGEVESDTPEEILAKMRISSDLY